MSQAQQTQNNKPQNNRFNITDTVIQAEPISVGYSITGTDVAEFVKKYLEASGIKGSTVVVEALSTGTVNPKLGVIVSFNKSNSEIISKGGNAVGDDILPVFASNVQTGGLHASKLLTDAIAPLASEQKVKVYRSRANKKYVYIPVCPIKTIAAMLKSTPKFSYISIVDVRRIKGEIIVKAFKQLREPSMGNGRSNLFDESMKRHF